MLLEHNKNVLIEKQNNMNNHNNKKMEPNRILFQSLSFTLPVGWGRI